MSKELIEELEGVLAGLEKELRERREEEEALGRLGCSLTIDIPAWGGPRGEKNDSIALQRWVGRLRQKGLQGWTINWEHRGW
jgi:hypothetical protein